MRNFLLIVCCGFSTLLHAQVIPPSDTPANYTSPSQVNGDAHWEAPPFSFPKAACPNIPVVQPVPPVCAPDSVTFTATNGLAYAWFDAATAGTQVGFDSVFTTPSLNTTTNYYVAALCNPTQGMMAIPPQSTTYSGQIRGYYFTAPTDFLMTGVRVPTDVVGAQTIEVIRFNSGPPPAYATVTNDFVSLAYFNQDNSTNILPVNIPVNQGDVIGIYGWRGTTCSYGPASPSTNIAGVPVTLYRSGMQYSLNTSQMFDVWSENAASIGRTEMYYQVYGDTSTRVMVTAHVNPSYQLNTIEAICQGDSFFVGGDWQTTGGVYNDTMQTWLGCDSLLQTTLFVTPLPAVTAGNTPYDTVCVNWANFNLPPGSPSQGQYSGPGITGNSFSPATAGAGTHNILYAFTDGNGCTGVDTLKIVVEPCTGIEESWQRMLEIYPNPGDGIFNLNFGTEVSGLRFIVTDITGRTLFTENGFSGSGHQLDLSNYPSGVYILQVLSGNVTATYRLTRQ